MLSISRKEKEKKQKRTFWTFRNVFGNGYSPTAGNHVQSVQIYFFTFGGRKISGHSSAAPAVLTFTITRCFMSGLLKLCAAGVKRCLHFRNWKTGIFNKNSSKGIIVAVFRNRLCAGRLLKQPYLTFAYLMILR